MTGALSGIRIIEIAGLGPGPFAGMMLADHGAEVICVERPGGNPLQPASGRPADILSRSRRSIALDLKSPQAAGVIKALVKKADGLIEGFRPGVMDRLGLGPDDLLAVNPALAYGRMTGWGQTGPWAQRVGHDINYIALSGVLHGIGEKGGRPIAPQNLLGDFGGGGMMLAFGMLAAILSARTTGRGQVVDCAMTDGSALLSAITWGFRAQGLWRDERGVNLLDGGTHFYDTYRTRCGGHVAVGAIEPAFYAALRRVAGLADDPAFDAQISPAYWPVLKARLQEVFLTRTRDEWAEAFEADAACLTPVLSMPEARDHPHNAARQTFVTLDGITQPAPAPRLSQTPPGPPRAPRPIGADTDAILAEAGFDAEAIAALRHDGVVHG